ncbi:DUF6541 family protein [Cryobacterium soli]|uniref:DUF6541 family protein n=1 Tax=Cryobacterium soli TaxID=2220095 RepID=UPI000E7097A5|nr:DUF6541 family protein [Cryobacterium soli]
MTWLETAPLFLAAVAILFIPGLLIGVALGARRLTLLALAPLFTVTTVAVAATGGQFIGVRWGVLPVLVVALLLSAVLVAARVLWRKRWTSLPVREGRAGLIAAGGGLLFGLVAIGTRFTTIFGAPNHISQTFDNVFHLNAVRYILDTGSASPLTTGSLTYEFDGRTSFYPDMWHALVALLVDVTGASIPVAVNVMNIAIAGLVWPLACILLVRVVLGARPVALLAAGVLSAGFAAFPALMVDFGVLYPNLLAISMLPAALAMVALVAGFGVEPDLPVPARWLALAGLLPGLALAHPSTLMALIAFSVPIAVFGLIRHLRALRTRHAGFWPYARVTVVAGLSFGIAAAVLLVGRPTVAAAFWGPRESFKSAVVATLTNSVVGRPADYLIAALMLLGIVALIVTRRQPWLIGSFIVAAGLYIVCASFPIGFFRYGLTGIWYNDSYRLAALMPVVVLPLAATGVVWLADLIQAGVARMRQRRVNTDPAAVTGTRRTEPVGAVVAGVAIIAILAVGTQTGQALDAATTSGQKSYKFTASSPLLSPDELTLLDRLDDEVPSDATVVGSPWTGSSLVYAISDRRALLPAIFGERDSDTLLLMAALRDATTDSEVCAAVNELDVDYALDFGPREVHGGVNQIAGLSELADSPGLELVDREGDASLYRITACD